MRRPKAWKSYELGKIDLEFDKPYEPYARKARTAVRSEVGRFDEGDEDAHLRTAFNAADRPAEAGRRNAEYKPDMPTPEQLGKGEYNSGAMSVIKKGRNAVISENNEVDEAYNFNDSQSPHILGLEALEKVK